MIIIIINEVSNISPISIAIFSKSLQQKQLLQSIPVLTILEHFVIQFMLNYILSFIHIRVHIRVHICACVFCLVVLVFLLYFHLIQFTKTIHANCSKTWNQNYSHFCTYLSFAFITMHFLSTSIYILLLFINIFIHIYNYKNIHIMFFFSFYFIFIIYILFTL